MKTLYSNPISPFGGLNFVLEEAVNLRIDKLLEANLPVLSAQSKYNWFDIFMSYWSVFFCGGDCAEDLSVNIKEGVQNNPFVKIPSPDRVLSRIKSLSEASESFTTDRGGKEHVFSLGEKMNRLNLRLLSRLPEFNKQGVILDYDNTILFSEKADAKYTYKKEKGYYPGVGMIGKHIVYVENRNGDSTAHVLQHETIDRMSSLLTEFGITVDAIRADSASYTYEIIKSMERAAKHLFVKARMTDALERAIAEIEEWKEVPVEGSTLLRGSTRFTPFIRYARGNKEKTELLKQYRIVVTKEPRKDGQINLFTKEAYNYSVILTSNFELSDNQVVEFYNARGSREREFDELKNDFGWKKIPFSKLEENTTFLILMAMCKNLYIHMIEIFSRRVKSLSTHFRIKKFIFRFICIPGKWIKTGRVKKLRLYGCPFR